MKADWLRLWHDMPTDPKWRVVARKSGRPLAEVLAVYTMMLVEASKADERGSIAGMVDEDFAAALDMDEEAVAAIRVAMLDRVHDGAKLTGWDKRQPKREDDTAAQRKREQRERDKANGHAASHDVTQSHARGEERREEGSVVETSSTTADPAKAMWEAGKRLLTNGGVQAAKAGALLGKWRRDHGDEALIAALGRCQREGAIDPVAFIEGCLRSHRRARPEAHQPEMVVPC